MHDNNDSAASEQALGYAKRHKCNKKMVKNKKKRQ
jgi:hypothetical protein